MRGIILKESHPTLYEGCESRRMVSVTVLLYQIVFHCLECTQCIISLSFYSYLSLSSLWFLFLTFIIDSPSFISFKKCDSIDNANNRKEEMGWFPWTLWRVCSVLPTSEERKLFYLFLSLSFASRILLYQTRICFFERESDTSII